MDKNRITDLFKRGTLFKKKTLSTEIEYNQVKERFLRCKAMELESLRCIVSHLKRVVVLKNHSIPKSKFRKSLVENTTIIAHEIDELRLHILETLRIKTKKKSN